MQTESNRFYQQRPAFMVLALFFRGAKSRKLPVDEIAVMDTINWMLLISCNQIPVFIVIVLEVGSTYVERGSHFREKLKPVLPESQGFLIAYIIAMMFDLKEQNFGENS